jgi:hypothetical protein
MWFVGCRKNTPCVYKFESEIGSKKVLGIIVDRINNSLFFRDRKFWNISDTKNSFGITVTTKFNKCTINNEFSLDGEVTIEDAKKILLKEVEKQQEMLNL